MTKKSLIVKKAAEIVGQGIQENGGIPGKSIKMLHFFTREIMRLPLYDININKEDKLIIIAPYIEDREKPLFLKPKDDTVFSRLVEKLRLPNWEIRFSNKEDYEKLAGENND